MSKNIDANDKKRSVGSITLYTNLAYVGLSKFQNNKPLSFRGKCDPTAIEEGL